MIRWCTERDIERINAVVNAAAEAYRDVIPADRWKEPYMPLDELCREIASGVAFLGYAERRTLLGVMGLQDLGEVALIRHAYVQPSAQRRGIGGALVTELKRRSPRPMLVGTWAAAAWAIRFYEAHGFALVEPEQKDALLRAYWSIPERQIETSVVLADPRWFAAQQPDAGPA